MKRDPAVLEVQRCRLVWKQRDDDDLFVCFFKVIKDEKSHVFLDLFVVFFVIFLRLVTWQITIKSPFGRICLELFPSVLSKLSDDDACY